MIKLERLARLATLLEKGSTEAMGLEFNLEQWSNAEVRRSGLFGLRKNFCNTSACAVGLACLSGEFAADNLKYEIVKKEGGRIVPVYSIYRNWNAVNSFFGLTPEQSTYLFLEESYSGPTVGPEAEKIVAKRLRDFIAKHSPKPTKATKKAVAEIKKRALQPVQE